MISPSCHQPYIATVANACGCTQGPFWCAWGIILVGQGNSRGVELKQFRTCLTYASSFFPFLPTSLKRGCNAVSAERSMEFGNIVRVETLRYLTKITTLQRKADRKHTRSLR